MDENSQLKIQDNLMNVGRFGAHQDARNNTKT